MSGIGKPTSDVNAPIIVWTHRDLRLDDHPALSAAALEGRPVIPVFISAPEEEGAGRPGGAERLWLKKSLRAFDLSLRPLHSRLVVRQGPSLVALRQLIKETRAAEIYWNERLEPDLRERDSLVQDELRRGGVGVRTFRSGLLFDPDRVKTLGGKPYQVFTPFWRACLAYPEKLAPIPPVGRLTPPARWPASDSLEMPVSDSGVTIPQFDLLWRPGEMGAWEKLKAFAREGASRYAIGRDHPSERGTSRLSPHLHFGEISPRRVWQKISDPVFRKELGWREFAHYLLRHFPHTQRLPLRAEFGGFPWAHDPQKLTAWQEGKTGYPIVDAGMRELLATGWMHNRVRMITASFLVKDLLISWLQGAEWFRERLVDADLANNTFGWQWSAGCGADAAPFFRIFNPVLQGRRFDPKGDYVRRWVRELANVPVKHIHAPWLWQGFKSHYPRPIVDHSAARLQALAAFRKTKATRSR